MQEKSPQCLNIVMFASLISSFLEIDFEIKTSVKKSRRLFVYDLGEVETS